MTLSKEAIQAVALPPDDALVSGVHQIANAIMRKKGYAVSVTLSEVRVVMEATYLLVSHAQSGITEEGAVCPECGNTGIGVPRYEAPDGFPCLTCDGKGWSEQK